MPTIRIYEAALCCDTGVCGADVDKSLVEVTANVRSLQGLGADIARHNLAGDPTAFTGDETVRAFMHTVGSKGLPLTVVDGVTVAIGSYPSLDQLRELAGLDRASGPGVATDAGEEAPRTELGLTGASGGCCGGASGCC